MEFLEPKGPFGVPFWEHFGDFGVPLGVFLVVLAEHQKTKKNQWFFNDFGVPGGSGGYHFLTFWANFFEITL